MPRTKENSPNLKLVETDDIICPKCNLKNKKDVARCTECGFPIRGTKLIKIIPIELLKRR